MGKMTREETIAIGARYRAGYLLEQFGYTMGLAKLEGDKIARRLPAGFLDKFQACADAVSEARKNKVLMAAESKASTQTVGDAMREAKEWRRKVTALGRKCSRLDMDVPDILTSMNGATTVVEVTGRVEAMLKMLSVQKKALVGEDLDRYLAEGEGILAALKTADADQELKRLKGLSDAVAEFYFQKGTLTQRLKAVNEAGRELHYKSPVDAAKYNLSILYRNAGKRKSQAGSSEGT